MLFVKPYLLNRRHKQRQKELEEYGRVSRMDSEDENSEHTRVQSPHHGEEGEEFDFAEIFVHQVITLSKICAASYHSSHDITMRHGQQVHASAAC